MNANDVIDRVKNLKEFQIEFTFNRDFLFSGKLPFDLLIGPNEKGIATVLAATQEEAEERVMEYFHNTIIDQGYDVDYDEDDLNEDDDD